MIERHAVDARELRSTLNILGSLFLIFWLLYSVPLQNLNWDPSFYYAHVRSPVIDGDIDFANDGLPPFLVATRTRTGLTPSIWSAGPALTWAPFFLLGHAVTWGERLAGLPKVPDGYGPFYLTFCALGSALVGWLGVVGCYLIARRVAGIGSALIAAIAIWFGSPLFYYMYKYPLMAHAPTVAFISAALYLWMRIADDWDAPGCWFLLGLAIGVAALMRWQNGLFAIIVPFALHVDRQQRGWWRDVSLRLGLAAAGAMIGFLPQIIIWWRLYGQPLALPQGSGFLRWFEPQLALLLFSSNHGLFVWQPITLIGCLGLPLFLKRVPRLGIALLLVVLLETYLNSVVRDWWGGGGFGPRRFDWSLPILALGGALFFEAIWAKRVLRVAMITLLGVFLVYEMTLVQAHYYDVLPNGQPFPRQDYDEGRPLPSAFFARIIFGTLHDPAYLIMTRPNIWTEAVPPVQTLVTIVRGKAVGELDVAIGVTCILAVTLVIAICAGIIWARHRVTSITFRLLTIQWITGVTLVWVIIASATFVIIRP